MEILLLPTYLIVVFLHLMRCSCVGAFVPASMVPDSICFSLCAHETIRIQLAVDVADSCLFHIGGHIILLCDCRALLSF